MLSHLIITGRSSEAVGLVKKVSDVRLGSGNILQHGSRSQGGHAKDSEVGKEGAGGVALANKKILKQYHPLVEEEGEN